MDLCPRCSLLRTTPREIASSSWSASSVVDMCNLDKTTAIAVPASQLPLRPIPRGTCSSFSVSFRQQLPSSLHHLCKQGEDVVQDPQPYTRSQYLQWWSYQLTHHHPVESRYVAISPLHECSKVAPHHHDVVRELGCHPLATWACTQHTTRVLTESEDVRAYLATARTES